MQNSEKSLANRYAIHVMMTVVIFAATFAIGNEWRSWHFRVELHENAHLKAYEEEGIPAHRSSYTTVTSARFSIDGMEAGYIAEAGFIARSFVVIFALTALIGMSLEKTFLVGAIGLPWGAYNDLQIEMYGYAPDIMRIADRLNATQYRIATEILYGVIATGVIVSILAAVFLWLTKPTDRQRNPDIYEAVKGAAQPTAGHTVQPNARTHDPSHPEE